MISVRQRGVWRYVVSTSVTTISNVHVTYAKQLTVAILIYFVNIYSTKRFGLCLQICMGAKLGL
jgi:hypothetical protein